MQKVLVIIPAYNEEESITDVIFSVKSLYPDFDVLVINDASTDETGALAEKSNQAIVINLPFNLGIGGAVQCGLKYASKYNYQYALQFDADGQHLITEIDKIYRPVLNGESDCMIGSRFVQEDESFRPSSIRMIGIRMLRFFSYLYTKQKITDQTSGFRAFNRKAIEFLAEHYPGDYPEPAVIILLAKNGFSIKEVFTQMRERQGGVSSIPLWRGPYYIIRVLLSMTMAAMRFKI